MRSSRRPLDGRTHQTCGGRSLNDDVIDKLLTLLVNGGKGPRVSDGVDRPATPVLDVFPYQAPTSVAGQARTGPCNRPSKQIRTATMTANSTVALELDDIQAGALEPRPVPYAGVYQILRLDDRHAGRWRLIPYLNSVASFDPKMPVSLAVALSFQGLKALGVPEESLASFPPEFQQGMAARSAELGDVGRTLPSTGRNRWVRRTPISWWLGSRPTLPAWRPLSATPATPYAICPASCPFGNRTCTPRLTCATCSVSRTA